MQYLLIVFSLFFWSCEEQNEDIYGCTDPASCTYEPNANVSNPDSCLEFDECGECAGDNSTCLDDCGVPNGDGPDCNGSCNNENVELWGNCYNIENTITLIEQELIGVEIPSEIGELINLEGLILYGNQHLGEIPSEIGNLTNLLVLDLGYNNIRAGSELHHALKKN